MDALQQHVELASERSSVLADLGLVQDGYAVLTAHREENVDSPENLRAILDGVRDLANVVDLPIVFPVHPRTHKQVISFGLEASIGSIASLRRIDPVGYLDFLNLLANARIVITDSGGIQEEACILGVPCVTIRENTERPETVEVGANVIAGTNPGVLVRSVETMLGKERDWSNPFGDGTAGAQVVSRLLDESRVVL